MTSKIAQAIAKVVAYLNCGKQADAEQWFKDLADMLGLAHLLK